MKEGGEGWQLLMREGSGVGEKLISNGSRSGKVRVMREATPVLFQKNP